MSQSYPEDTESEASREGTLAHELAVAMHTGEDLWPTTDPEMCEHIKGYVAVLHPDAILESKVRISEHNWGTCDAYHYDPYNMILQVWDLKYGFGNVEPYNNWQLINYTMGIALQYGWNGVEDQNITVRLHIYQPRAYGNPPLKTWETKLADLRGHFNKLTNAVQRGLSPAATCESGGHCKHCPALFACPAARNSAILLFEAVSGTMPNELSGESLASYYEVLLRAEKHIESVKSAIEAQIVNELTSGNMVGMYGLVPTNGKLKWSLPADQLFEIGDAMGIDLRKAPDAITPTQAKKLGFPIDGISSRESTLKLTKKEWKL